MVKCLLENGASTNAVDYRHKTALMWACEAGHLEVVKLILTGPSTRKRSLGDMSPDSWVAANVTPILECVDGFGNTALLLALKSSKNLEIMRSLIIAGACVNVADIDGVTALTHAIRDYNIKSSRNVQRHMPINRMAINHMAMNNTRSLRFLTKITCDVSEVIVNAVLRGDSDLIYKLLQYAGVPVMNSVGKSPLMAAILAGNDHLIMEFVFMNVLCQSDLFPSPEWLQSQVHSLERSGQPRERHKKMVESMYCQPWPLKTMCLVGFKKE